MTRNQATAPLHRQTDNKIHFRRSPGAWATALAGAAFTALASLAAVAAPPTAEQYAQRPSLYNVVMSPSGKRAAMIVTDGKDGRRALAVLDLPPAKPPRIVASYGDADVETAAWVTEDRLVYDAYQSGLLIRSGGGGTFAVNHDGSERTELIAFTDVSGAPTGSRVRNRTLSREWSQMGRRWGSNEIIVRESRWSTGGEWVGGKVARLDTKSGLLTPVNAGAPAFAQQWVFNADGEPRVVRALREGRDRVYLRTPGTEEWAVISDVPEYDPTGMQPLFLEADDQLVVRTNAGRDTEGLYIYDLKKRALDPDPLVRAERYDLGSVRFDFAKRRVLAARLISDRPQTVWFSPKLAALQKSLDDSLPPDRTNEILCDECEGSAFFVVRSSSDQHPGEYLLYDPAQRTLRMLGQTRPTIDPGTQGHRSFHWIQARDGLGLPVIVTHPPGSKPTDPLPAVVLVHGGPWVQGPSTLWDPEAQFLATRGWRVLEPQFRGTTGYGARHYGASFKQWGRSMQDDLADAVAWAAREGMIDPKRVCIYGASYGGYAALMGPVRDPGVYRCAASLVGVTDIMLMFTNYMSDLSADSKQYSLPQLLGDPEKDRAMLDASSPLRRVADIKVPVLLAVGLLDRRVPREHGDAFESAARKAGVNIERVNYGDEGHGFTLPSNQTDFWQRLQVFLDRNLKP